MNEAKNSDLVAPTTTPTARHEGNGGIDADAKRLAELFYSLHDDEFKVVMKYMIEKILNDRRMKETFRIMAYHRLIRQFIARLAHIASGRRVILGRNWAEHAELIQFNGSYAIFVEFWRIDGTDGFTAYVDIVYDNPARELNEETARRLIHHLCWHIPEVKEA